MVYKFRPKRLSITKEGKRKGMLYNATFAIVVTRTTIINKVPQVLYDPDLTCRSKTKRRPEVAHDKTV